MTLSATLQLGIILMLWASLATAQSNLGALLDAGAKKLSAEEFRQEVVQRVIVGPTATGGSIQVMYASNGAIQGTGSYTASNTATLLAPISGEWTTDDNGRICTSMQIGSALGMGSGVSLPSRCQFWFKYAEQYFFSDSDSDRSARVLRRTLKP